MLNNCWTKKKEKESLGKFLELYRKIELFLAKFKYKERRIKRWEEIYSNGPVAQFVDGWKGHVSLPVHWSGFKVKRPPFQLGRKAFQKISMKITSIEAPRNILQNSMKKIFRVTFIEIKEKKDWTTHHYVKTVLKTFV